MVEGNEQNITVNTEPPGASCELTREGEVLAVVDPTPDVVEVEKGSDDISVLCEMDDHEPGAGALASSFQGMTVGNFLLGGVIGVAVDAASGAM